MKNNLRDTWDPFDVTTEPATSIVLIRENRANGIEVYITRRQLSLRFMGGFYVFPGGKVDTGDYDVDIISRSESLDTKSASRILGGSIDPAIAPGYWVAGIRELFEEAGILMVYDRNREFPDFDDGSVRELYDSHRKNLQNGDLRFIDILLKERLSLATDRLMYLYHFVTPPGSSRRFDTRFFVAVAPSTQRPRFHQAEISEGFWIPVNESIEKARMGDLDMILPTFMCLEAVAKYSSIKDLEQSLSKGRVVS